jgi:hypothetical protein
MPKSEVNKREYFLRRTVCKISPRFAVQNVVESDEVQNRPLSNSHIHYCLKHLVSRACAARRRPKKKYDWMLKPVIVYPSVNRLIEVFEK